MFIEAYKSAFKKGCDHLVSIHVSSKLSAVYNSAMIGAGGFKNRITVLDSQNLSLGLGFQAIAAAEVAEQGADLDQVLKLIQDTQERVRVIAMLDTLTQLKRSGRVSWAQAQRLFLETLVRDGEVLIQKGGKKNRWY